MSKGKNEVHSSSVMPHSNAPDVYQEVLDEYNRFLSEHPELQQRDWQQRECPGPASPSHCPAMSFPSPNLLTGPIHDSYRTGRDIELSTKPDLQNDDFIDCKNFPTPSKSSGVHGLGDERNLSEVVYLFFLPWLIARGVLSFPSFIPLSSMFDN
jgi:hypothetical protein